TLAAVLQRAAAAQRPWLQTPGDRSPELVGTRYHSPRTHCLIGYKFHTQVTPTIPSAISRPPRSASNTRKVLLLRCVLDGEAYAGAFVRGKVVASQFPRK